MSTTTFKIIYNLEGLDDAAIEQYKADVSNYFGLDPAVNWFDVLWMTDPDTGLRRRQLYARRGTTDILRDRRKISVDEMVQHDGPGYVSHTAKGHDATGRTEMAVGAHSTEGLKGEKLAAAVSTSETRAGRRLTLKFCGLGILDYTEVTDPVEVKASPTELAAVAPAPIFAPSLPTPSAAPGKMVDPKERAAADSAAQALAESAEIAKAAARAITVPAALGAPYGISKSGLHGYAEAMEQAQTIRDDGTRIPVPSGASTVVDTTPTPAEAPAEPKRRRGRKKNTVDIASPGQESVQPAAANESERSANGNGLDVAPLSPTCLDCKQPLSDHGMDKPLPELGYSLRTAPHQPVLAPPQPAPTIDFPGKPSKEQEAQYRERLREYSNVILPGAGMVPSQGIGGPSAKLRIYAERMAAKPTQQMTVEDWDEFFEGMKSFRERNGDKNLVKYINDVIGAK